MFSLLFSIFLSTSFLLIFLIEFLPGISTTYPSSPELVSDFSSKVFNEDSDASRFRRFPVPRASEALLLRDGSESAEEGDDEDWALSVGGSNVVVLSPSNR